MATEQTAEIPCTHSDPCYRVRYEVKGEHWADWVLESRVNLDDWEHELGGHLKWDGCMEWRGHVHICCKEDVDELADALKAIRRIVGAAIPAWDGGE